MAEASERIWFFGYGSNMSSENLTKKKRVAVFDSTPAKLIGYKLAFSLAGPPKVEPRFANCERGGANDCIHGVAFETDKQSIERMDSVESGYDKANVILEAYDGRKLNGFVYVNKPHLGATNATTTATSAAAGAAASSGDKPSDRYLQLLIRGAEAAGLEAGYVERLRQIEVYQPSAETLQLRQELVGKATDYPLREMTAASLGEDPNKFVSVLGFIFRVDNFGYFASHRGREITNRSIRHYLNLPLDANSEHTDPQADPRMFPSLRLLREHYPQVLDYVWTWFDYYAHITAGSIVARHSGFANCQANESASLWTLPTE